MDNPQFRTQQSIFGFALAAIAFLILTFYLQFGFIAFPVTGAIASTSVTLRAYDAKHVCYSLITFIIGFVVGGFLIAGSLLGLFMGPQTFSYDSFFSFYSLYILGFIIAGAIAAIGTFRQPVMRRMVLGAKSFAVGSAVGGLLLGGMNAFHPEPSMWILAPGIILSFVVSGRQFSRAGTQSSEAATALSITRSE